MELSCLEVSERLGNTANKMIFFYSYFCSTFILSTLFPDLLRSPSYRDLPKETAERIKALMEERIKMLSSNESSTSDETKSDGEKETKIAKGNFSFPGRLAIL